MYFYSEFSSVLWLNRTTNVCTNCENVTCEKLWNERKLYNILFLLDRKTHHTDSVCSRWKQKLTVRWSQSTGACLLNSSNTRNTRWICHTLHLSNEANGKCEIERVGATKRFNCQTVRAFYTLREMAEWNSTIYAGHENGHDIGKLNRMNYLDSDFVWIFDNFPWKFNVSSIGFCCGPIRSFLNFETDILSSANTENCRERRIIIQTNSWMGVSNVIRLIGLPGSSTHLF